MSARELDRLRTVRPPDAGSLPRHGRIRLGEKVPAASGGERPAKIDYFRVTSDDDGTTSPAQAAAFHSVYGDRPTLLHAWLPGAAKEDVFEAAWYLYGAGGLKRKCTGPKGSLGGTQEALQRGKEGGWEPCECACDTLPKTSALRCKFTWRLALFLPEVSSGVWDIVSGSDIGWNQIEDSLANLAMLAGDLTLLKVDVSLNEAKVHPLELKGKTSTVYVVDVASPASAIELGRGGGRFQIAEISAGAARYELPANPLNAEPDELIHHAQIEAGARQGASATSAADQPEPDHGARPQGEPPAAATPQPATVEHPTGAGGSGAASGPSVADQIRAMSELERAELRRRVPIADGAKTSQVAAQLGDWSSDLQRLLEQLRRYDCSFAELPERIAAAVDKFQEQIDSDTLPPTASQELGLAGNPEPGQAIPMYGPGAPA